jgi:hypothetical protein
MISVMREIWLEAWLTRYGLKVLMASSIVGKDDHPRYNVVIKTNLVLGLSMDKV